MVLMVLVFHSAEGVALGYFSRTVGEWEKSCSDAVVLDVKPFCEKEIDMR